MKPEENNKKVQNPVKSAHAEREERILADWNKQEIFQKTLKKDAPKGEYIFYDGPPFATGTPHYGHLLAGTIKDVIPRWKTMQGYRVPRRWGWDCHGLPVENLIEKELNLATKKDILTFGIEKFNDAAKASVMRYADEWRHIIPRVGRFVDMENDYRTMDATYTESVWWIFKRLYDKGLIFKDFKSMNMCPRCGTTLSNFEVAQGYKDITDITVYVKFKMKNEPAFFLAWTTTPWTLPGNVALAVNPEIDYVKVKMSETGELMILAKSRISSLKEKKYEILEEMKGSKLVGEPYEPLFPYYAHDTKLKNAKNGWKVYPGDFVTTEDGTGIVHIAPAFGSDDYNLLKKYDLPFVQHVTTDGKFKDEVVEWKGMPVKPKPTDEDKNAHQKADVEIIKWLAHNGKLFEKEKLIHSYPHCWRCDTPLLNYAASSWFVKVTDLKDKLVKENEKVTWVPKEIGEGRFGNWLLGARDWAISRTRFWGAPIPVWTKEGTDEPVVIGSVKELKKHSAAKNEYYVMRHGEATNNIDGILSGVATALHHLTPKGREQVQNTAKTMKKMHFDMVFVSPFLRTQETAEILMNELGWKKEIFHTDERIRELGSGTWNGKQVEDYFKEFGENRFEKAPEGGENYADIKKRMGDFLYDTEKKYSGKKILIVSHECPIFLLQAAASGLDRKTTLALNGPEGFLKNAELKKLDFSPIPHNAEYELDLHRPYIDEIDLRTDKGEKLVRVPDVFDCWFESGAMPYGEAHYPFCNESGGVEFEPDPGLFGKSKGFPADFIAEGLDQTRGWFYSMIVLGVALFGKSPYKKVIVNGLVLAEDGQKMSKRLKNYPDPMYIVDKYGADALRYYLLSSPVVRSQDLCFSEKGVDEIAKKIVNRVLNVLSFYEMYNVGKLENKKSSNVIDRWIISRLNETVVGVTKGLEDGELDRASRPFMDFIDDLSTWYIRRSRERFKGEDEEDKASAIFTTRFVLMELSKLLAPFMPFLAEEVYKKLGGKEESVHLESWPVETKIDSGLLESMSEVRNICSKGLEARMAAKINVRQPLAELKVKKALRLDQSLIDLIKDEVNVKSVTFANPIGGDLELDTNISPELKKEGEFRELLRKVQDLRKSGNLKVGDSAKLTLTAKDREIAGQFEKELMRLANLTSIVFGEIEKVEVNA